MNLPPGFDWLRPPTFPDRTKTQQAAMVWGLLWSLLLLSIPIMLALDFGTPIFNSIVAADVVLFGLLAATRRGNVGLASFTIPTLILVVVTYINIISDGAHDIGVIAYMLVIALAALLIGTRALTIYTLLVVAAFTGIAVAEILGVLQNDFSYKTSNVDIVIFCSVCAIFAILLRVTLEYLIDNANAAAANERAVMERNTQLEASRAEVERLNAELERGINARTADLRSATAENEQLFNISRDVNSAQDYVELVEAVARHLDHPEYSVILALFDTQDRTTARIASVVAQRITYQPHAVPIYDDHYRADLVRQWLNIPDVLVIHDVKSPPPEAHPDMLHGLQLQGAGALMITELRLNSRVLGYLIIGLPYAHEFSAHDIRVIRAASELLSAAVERMRLYSDQVTTAEQLRDADEVKSRFMANMSHELRTPLNAILNFTRFVSSGMLGTINAEQLDALNKTIASGKHLLSLINDVLDVTKIESQMLTLFVESNVDLHAEVEATITAGEALLADKPVTLVRDVDPDLPLVTGDRRRLRQVLLNLVSNACKFTESGTVTVTARREGENILLRVRDTGPGIAEDDYVAIFEPFRQSKRGLMISGGTGLGLAIARRLVEAHQGTLTVESVLGEGASFTIMLPVASPVLAAQAELMESHP